ncbi:MAG: hypothetical protein M0R80_13875 [Proteobacteria bacterium]|jgi:hypothetical protein|nr:hypothetical protein [Pseudomonadota bacterium]
MMKELLVFGVSLSIGALGVVSCGDDDDRGGSADGDADSDSDTDSDTDADTDSDSDSDECVPTAEWGSGFNVGSAVANWSLNGMFDGDLDGVVDETTADFTLEDVYCHGKKSIVIAVSDQDCGPCGDWYGQIGATSFYEDMLAANGTMLMFYSSGLGATAKTAEQCYEYFSADYGFEPGYYVNGPPTQFTFPYFPFMAVIDLNTGELMGKDISDTDYLMPEEILAFVEAANEE